MPPRRLQVCGLKARGPCALPRGAVARATTATRGVRHCSKFRAQDDAFDASGSLAHPSGLRSQTRAFPITRVPSFIPTSSNTPKTCPRSVVSPYTATSEHAASLLTTRHGRGASHTAPWHLAHLAAASAFRCPSLRPARRRRALACAPGCRGAAAQESNTNSPAGDGPRRLARRLARAPPRAARGRRCASAGCRARTGAGSAPSGRRLLPARRAQLWCQRLFSRCAGAYFRACVWGSRHRLPVTLSNVSHQAEPQS